jgi:hypothetical protein
MVVMMSVRSLSRAGGASRKYERSLFVVVRGEGEDRWPFNSFSLEHITRRLSLASLPS